jgi:hypothetical protein
LIGTTPYLTVPSLRAQNISICCAMSSTSVLKYSSQQFPYNTVCYFNFIE